MGDISAEPSMEDILSSIKRIIAEDNEAAQPGRIRRGSPAASTASFPRPAGAFDGESATVLELSEFARDADNEPVSADDPIVRAGDPIVSHDVLATSRGSLDALTKMIARPEAEAAAGPGGKNMEAFVADMLRPLLREWLDANLPELVEKMVAKEIARITRNR